MDYLKEREREKQNDQKAPWLVPTCGPRGPHVDKGALSTCGSRGPHVATKPRPFGRFVSRAHPHYYKNVKRHH